MLAEAFCTSDERVRSVQAELDEAQAHRTRTLAAFAVTVGNDGSIADVVGLNEREVRLARRTVGKEDARSLAADLLRQSAETPPPQPQPEEPSALAPEGASVPAQRTEPPAPDTFAQPAAPTAVSTVGTGGTGGHVSTVGTGGYAPSAAPAGRTGWTDTAPAQVFAREEQVVWSPAMDSVLVWSWQSGIDLQAVAAELSLDVRALLQRVQALAADGLLVLRPSHGDSGQAGRHRRHDDFFVSAPDSPEELYTHGGYVTHPY